MFYQNKNTQLCLVFLYSKHCCVFFKHYILLSYDVTALFTNAFK